MLIPSHTAKLNVYHFRSISQCSHERRKGCLVTSVRDIQYYFN